MAATTHVVEAAKSVAERNNSDSQNKLATAADELQNAADSAIRLREKRAAVAQLGLIIGKKGEFFSRYLRLSKRDTR